MSRASFVPNRFRLSGRGRLAVVTVAVVTASMLVVPALPASAKPVVPPGATTSPPKQAVGTAANRPHAVGAESTTARTAGPSVATAADRPAVPGAVGPEIRYPDPVIPPASGGPLPVTLHAGPTVPARTSTGMVPGASREVTAERTPRSTVFVNPDGTKTRRLYQEDMFVRGQRGAYVRVDPTLTRSTAGRWTPAAGAPVSFASSATDPALAIVDTGGGTTAGFRLDSATPVDAIVGVDGARYREVRPGADLVLSPTADGLKELLVLKSADAPTSWMFPLNLRGVTPGLDPATGDVMLIDDDTKEIRARIPAGFMYDSAVHPRSGDPAVSHAVNYTLLKTDAGWSLRIDIDGGWLRDPARVFPVMVDPTLRTNTENDDTFASSRDWPNGGPNDTVLRVGTYDGVEKAASYLHFNAAMSALTNKYILSATLNLYNVWSYSCRSYPMVVYPVTQPWTASTVKKFPGPAYDAANALAWANFAYGYDSCSADRWVTLGIPADKMNRWVHGVEPFYGFTLRSDTNSVDSWKKFASANFGNATAIPFLDVNYADEGAAHSLPNSTFNPPVSTVAAGKLVARVTNWGASTWTPSNGFRLSHTVVNASGTTVNTGTYTMPTTVAPGQSADVEIQVAALPMGSYTLRWDMLNPAGTAFQTAYGSPAASAGFTVTNSPPTIVGNWPLNNADVDTRQPTLWANYFDPDNYPIGARRFSFRVCANAPPTESGCQSSGWITNSSWRVPDSALDWGQTASWYVTVSDGSTQSPEIGPLYFTPTVPQPPMTGQLVGAADNSIVPNVDPGVGNFARTFTDAAVQVPGPPLAVTRTYNSQDPRTSGAFGAGWSSPFDVRLVEDWYDRTQLYTAPDGRQMRFGRGPDNDVYVGPAGINLTLVYSWAAGGSYVLTDRSGSRFVFDDEVGMLQAVVDADGRVQEYDFEEVETEDGPAFQLREIRDLSSGRRLFATWTDGHVTSVATDPPAAGQPAPTWTYTYTGDRLTMVCGPLSAGSCVSYTYADSSHYRSLVLDDKPVAYWPLGETSGSVATNVAATAGANDAAYVSVTRGVPGALGGSPDPAVTFAGTAGSVIRLPDNLLSSATTFSAELWFKAAAGQSGVLLSEQNAMPGAGANRYLPLLYVGQDGSLRGGAPTATPTGPVLGLADKCVDVVGGTATNGTPVQLWDCTGAAHQRWSVRADGTIRALDKCLEAANGATANGTLLQIDACDGSGGQQWRATGATLVNPQSSRCVDVVSGSSANGARLEIRDCSGLPRQQWNPTGADDMIVSVDEVDDGQWHHVVLSANGDRYGLILDGVSVGEITGVQIDHLDRGRALVGSGHAAGFGSAPFGVFPFNGSVDEVAFYREPMPLWRAGEHHTAGAATSRLTGVTEPGGFTADAVTYDGATGRVVTTVDRHGAIWTVGQPTVANDVRQVTVSSTEHDAVTFAYDVAHGGRLVSRTSAAGQRRLEYNAADFVSRVIDENGNTVTIDTDARGNTIGVTTCRTAGVCNTEYAGYYLNPDDPLDRRNDRQIWRSDARSANAADTTYRTTNTLDSAGRVTQITRPVPAGQTTAPTETFTYSTGAGYTVRSEPRPYVPASGPPLTFDNPDDGTVLIDLPFPITFYGLPRTAMRVAVNGYATFTQTGDRAETPPYLLYDEPLADGLDAYSAVFPFWDDLDTTDIGTIHTAVTGTAPNRTFTVEWRDVGMWNWSGVQMSFEAVFAENGEFWYTYGPATFPQPFGETATVGANNAGGVNAIQYSQNEEVLQTGMTLVFAPTATPGNTPIAGLPLTTTAANGGVTTYGYNAASDRVTMTDPAGLTTTRTHDGLGRTTTAARSAIVNGSPVSYGTSSVTYNALSQPVTFTEPATTNLITGVVHTPVITTEYDDTGRPVRQTVSDSTGGDPSRVTVWGYDPAGRLTSVTDPDNAITAQQWDAAGDIVSVTRPGGLVLTYAYDDSHRPVQVTATGAGVDPMDPASTSLVLQSMAYDPAGRLASEVDAMGRETAYTYYGDDLPATAKRVRRDAEGTITSSTALADLEYDRAGNLTRRTTAGGVTTTFTYDPGGYPLTQVLDPAGIARTETYRTNPDGTLARVSLTGTEGVSGRVERVDYTYDAAGRLLTEVVDNTLVITPVSLTTRYDRDPRGLVTRVTDPSGVFTDFVYDDADRAVRTIGAERTVWAAGVRTDGVRPATTVGFNTFGDLTLHRLPDGSTTTVTVDAMGRPTAETLPAYTAPGGGSAVTPTTTTEYNSAGLPFRVTDPLGRVTTYGYDKYDRTVTITAPDPDGSGPEPAPVWHSAYDRIGNQLDVTDPTGAHTSATWDDLGRPVTRTQSERTGSQTVYYTTTTAYDDAGNATSVTTPRGKTSTAEYNKAGQQTKYTDPTGRFVTRRYDPAGRVFVTAAGQGSTYVNPAISEVYDPAGRRIAQRLCVTLTGLCNAALKTQTWEYDGAGRVIQAEGPFAYRVTNYTYDGAGQQTQVSQRVTTTPTETWIDVQLGYDAAGRPSRMVDGNGNATDYTYNPWGLPESTIEPATAQHPALADRTWTTAYDAAGQPVTQFLPGGVTRTQTFDGLGRVTVETGSGAEATTTQRRIGYDAVGRPTTMSGPAGDTTFTWNDRGLLTGIAAPANATTLAYDADDNLTARADPAGSGTFTYDDAGRLATATDPLTGTTATYGYDRLGRTDSINYGTGQARRTFAYNTHNQLSSETWRRPDGTTAASVSYQYDHDSHLTRRTVTGLPDAGVHEYGYDGAGRLTQWTRPDSQVISYGYDNASNRTSVTGPAGTRTTTYNARNQALTSTGGGVPDESRTWTPRGTLASSTSGPDTTTYSFDAFERLTQVARPGQTIDYEYDSFDRLARRNGAGFAYSDLSNNPTRSPLGAGEAKVFRDAEGTPLSAQTGTDPAQLIFANRVHGDVVAGVDPSTAAMTASATYDPFGQPTSTSGTLPAGFQGGYTDPDTGQVNAHSRWYEPGTGAFASRDTWTLAPDPVAQNNRYIYGNASPSNYADPDGHEPSWCRRWLTPPTPCQLGGPSNPPPPLLCPRPAGPPSPCSSGSQGHLRSLPQTQLRTIQAQAQGSLRDRAVDTVGEVDRNGRINHRGPGRGGPGGGDRCGGRCSGGDNPTTVDPRPGPGPGIVPPLFVDPTGGTGVGNPLPFLAPLIDVITGLVTAAVTALVGATGEVANGLGILVGGLIAELMHQNDPTKTGNGNDPCANVNADVILNQAKKYAEEIRSRYHNQEWVGHDQTVAVLGVCDKATGVVKYYFAGKSPLEEQQIIYGQSQGLIFAPGGGKSADPHAEQLVINKAQEDAKNGPVRPVAIYATNRFCGPERQDCRQFIKDRDGTYKPPVGKQIYERAAVWSPTAVWS